MGKKLFVANKIQANYIFLFTFFFRYRIHRVNGTIRNLIQCFMFFCKQLYAYTVGARAHLPSKERKDK